jgi:hypothetical protein
MQTVSSTEQLYSLCNKWQGASRCTSTIDAGNWMWDAVCPWQQIQSDWGESRVPVTLLHFICYCLEQELLLPLDFGWTKETQQSWYAFIPRPSEDGIKINLRNSVDFGWTKETQQSRFTFIPRPPEDGIRITLRNAVDFGWMKDQAE